MFPKGELALLREGVKRGAEMLDRRMPDWYTKIDVETLSLESTERCVLGQLGQEQMNGADEIYVEEGEYTRRYNNPYSFMLETEFADAYNEARNFEVNHGFNVFYPKNGEWDNYQFDYSDHEKFDILSQYWKEEIKTRRG